MTTEFHGPGRGMSNTILLTVVLLSGCATLTHEQAAAEAKQPPREGTGAAPQPPAPQKSAPVPASQPAPVQSQQQAPAQPSVSVPAQQPVPADQGVAPSAKPKHNVEED